MPSGTPGSSPRRSAKTRSVCFASSAVGQQVEGPDVAAPGVVDVEHAFIGGEGEAVGHDKVIDDRLMVPRSGVTRYTPAKVRSHCSGDDGVVRVGEVDAAVGLDHHVIGPVEPPPLEAVGDHGEAAVELLPGDPSGCHARRRATGPGGLGSAHWPGSSAPGTRTRLGQAHTSSAGCYECR